MEKKIGRGMGNPRIGRKADEADEAVDDDDDAETWLDGCLAACLTCLCNMYKLSFSLAPAHL